MLTCQQVTLESFLAWKKRKIEEKRKALSSLHAKKKKALKRGDKRQITGKDFFTLDPTLADGADDDDVSSVTPPFALRSLTPCHCGAGCG